MNDVFKEQLVKKQPTAKDTLIKVAAVALGIVLLFVSLCFEILAALLPLILVAICVALWYLFNRLSLEHEYIVTNSELDIDVIYGKRRRKRVYSGELKQVEIMCHVSDHGYDADFKGAEVTRDCSSGKESDNTYMFIAPYKGKKMKIIFTPNNDIIKAMYPYLGRRFKQKV